MKKLHITFVDFDDIKNPFLSGGQARATFEVSRRLVKMGHKVTIICSRYPKSKDQKYYGIFYKHIGLGSANIRFNNAAFFVALPLALWKFKADVIIECFTAPISTCFSPLYTKIPVIGMPTMFEAGEFSKKYHLPFHLVEKLGVRFYKYFLAYSPINQKKMLKMNPKIHFRLIPNGIGEEAFTKKVKDGNYALFIGRIDIVQKGLDLLLEAFARINGKVSTKLVIAGNGPKDEEKRLVGLIKKKKLEGKVRFVGRADGKKKELLLRGAKFGVYPSRFEDFPLVPLEYTSFSKPVVCFDVAGMKWVTDDVSLKARPFRVDELSQKLIEISTNSKLRLKLSKSARPFARKYGWNNISRDYANFCREVVDLDKRERQRL